MEEDVKRFIYNHGFAGRGDYYSYIYRSAFITPIRAMRISFQRKCRMGKYSMIMKHVQ